jgi:hypothetical protein
MDVFFRRERRGVSIVSRRRYRRKVSYLWRVRKPKMKTRGKAFVETCTRRRHFLYVAGVKVKNTPRVGWNKITRGDRDRTKRVCVVYLFLN